MLRVIFLIHTLIFSFGLNASEISIKLWNSDKTASASCVLNKFPVCQIVVNGKIIDVTPVTYQNIGKLGTRKIVEYDKVVTEPIEWIENKADIQVVKFKTEAWFKEKKYTITELVVVKGGKYIKR